MKSLVEYSYDFEKMLHLHVNDASNSERMLAYYQLYNKVSSVAGSIVKCGVTKESFGNYSRFIDFFISGTGQKSISFEKFSNLHYEAAGKTQQINNGHKISFFTGNVSDSIPGYLMEEPELKIACLHIDFDDYEATLTCLQFFFPRLVDGGILVLDNYFKKAGEYDAITDYFSNQPVSFSNFSAARGPHYFVR